jgi:transposase
MAGASLAVGIRGDRASPADPGRGKRIVFGLGPATKNYIAGRRRGHAKGIRRPVRTGARPSGPGSAKRASVPILQSRQKRLKVLVWDGGGLWVCAKRLEKGRFRWPAVPNGGCVVMRPEELAMLVDRSSMTPQPLVTRNQALTVNIISYLGNWPRPLVIPTGRAATTMVDCKSKSGHPSRLTQTASGSRKCRFHHLVIPGRPNPFRSHLDSCVLLGRTAEVFASRRH